VRKFREVGYRARGGACRLREKDLIILDSSQPPAEHVDVLVEILFARNLDDLHLSPASRRALQEGSEQT